MTIGPSAPDGAAREAERYSRQTMLAEVGVAGQARIAAASAAVDGEGLAHEVATRYARAAGVRNVEAGQVVVPSELEICRHLAARRVLAGSRAALAVLRSAVREPA